MARFRSHGWEPEELKIYWNAKQLENLCPKSQTEDEIKNETNTEVKIEKTHEAKVENLPPHDPSDVDVVLALRQYPVSNRNYDCTINYINKGIEKAVFDAPEDAQLIVLNFAVSYVF
jgi:DNA-directed RNA polymerase subunit F